MTRLQTDDSFEKKNWHSFLFMQSAESLFLLLQRIQREFRYFDEQFLNAFLANLL